MRAQDFCNWISGVLMMAEDESGGVSLSKVQYDKIKERLEQVESDDVPAHMRPGGPGTARC